MQQYWEHTYEDVLDVIAKMPEVAALIYRCKFKDGIVKKDTSLDYTGNYCSMMGYNDKDFQDLMRLYLVIHSVSIVHTKIQTILFSVNSSSAYLRIYNCPPIACSFSFVLYIVAMLLSTYVVRHHRRRPLPCCLRPCSHFRVNPSSV